MVELAWDVLENLKKIKTTNNLQERHLNEINVRKTAKAEK